MIRACVNARFNHINRCVKFHATIEDYEERRADGMWG